MREIKVSLESQAAMVRLLGKLKLIPASSVTDVFQVPDTCPISFFAKLGQLNEAKALKEVAEHLSIPLVLFDKENSKAALQTLEDQRLSNISNTEWKELRAYPRTIEDNILQVVFANPLDHEASSAIEFRTGLKTIVEIGQESQILALLGNSFREFEEQDLDNQTDIPQEKNELSFSEEGLRMDQDVSEPDMSAPLVIRLVNKILSQSIQKGASDIHFIPESEHLVVRIRLDGILTELRKVPAHYQRGIISRLKLLSSMDIAERRKPQDGRLRVTNAGKTKDLRFSSLPTAYGESIVIRVLTNNFSELNFDALAVPDHLQEKLRQTLKTPSGVILVTGPTGSGKTSTLYGSLLILRDGTKNIITIEDPVEYRIQGLKQVQINSKVSMDFTDSLRSILRQDPDVVMLGEIRDGETATIAMQAAQTGHLVLSTLHTKTAASALTRLRDLKVESYLISSSLSGILAQRLVRKVCPHCCQPITADERALLVEGGVPEEDLEGMVTAKGCKECLDIGYQGRVGLFSFLEITEQIRSAIRKEKSESEIEQIASENNFLTLDQEALRLLREGTTTIEEIERALGPIKQVLQRAYFPYQYDQDHETKDNPKERIANQVGDKLRKRHLLLVEDDSDTRWVMARLFEKEMFEVTEAEDGHDGLNKIYEKIPDIIVCDLMMPDMDGMELVQKLRGDSRTANIPILMLTAAATKDNEIDLIKKGADDFISKGSDSAVLMARIDRLLSRSNH